MKSHASMNRIYRLVWNAASSLWVAVAENAKGRGKGGSARSSVLFGSAPAGTAEGGADGSGFTLNSACRAALVLLTSLAVLTHEAGAADAANASVSAGAAGISTVGNTTTVNQSTQRVAIDWTSLSTAANEALRFNQPNAAAIALNRITGASPSELLGSLTANGQVFILNPNGVLFGAGSQVNVGGLVASTLSMSNADFMAGKHVFTGSGGSGSVVNQGTLNAGQGGYLALLAPEVRNEGVMTASLGTALLAAGNKVTLNLDNGSLLGYSIDQGAINALAENKHLIQANGGQVLLSAKAMDSLTTATVNNTGVIEAKTIQNKTGRILLMGDMETGTVNVGGTLDASAPNGGNGGFIETSAAHVKVAGGTKVTTLAPQGNTGTWLIDPTDFTISSGSGTQTTSGIGADTLSTNLATTSVTLETDASTGTDSGDINVNAAVTWSANTTLTLNAYNNININAAITATGTSAGLVLNHGNYATAGSVTGGTDYKVSAPVTLSGANATLAINGTSYRLIHSMAQLDAIDSTGLGGKYALAGDLNASGTTYTSALVGSSNTFAGTFAGLGHTISNLVIVAGSADFLGLFSRTGSGSVIRDIGLVGGSVSGNDFVGGLVGLNVGSISNAYATGDVSGVGRVGGLVGYNSGSISNAYATGSISGSSNYVGGLVGVNYGSISNAYATGSVAGSSDYVGGLVGGNLGSISNAYATGSVSGSSYYVGGVVGGNDGSISNAYWDSSTTGQSAAGVDDGTTINVNAIDSSSAYSHSSYANFGTWSETASGSGVWVATDSGGKAWVLIEGSTRPFLYSEYSTNIHNAHQLQLMALDTSASYTLTRNIDASETSGSNASGMWTTAGFASVGNRNEAFTGTLDGQGHTVNDLGIVRSTDDVGLIGYSIGATLQDIGLVGGSVSGNMYVGSLVGTLTGGSVVNAYSTAAVSGSGDNVGGLVGLNAAGSVSNAYSTGQVTGSANNVGGLVGSNAYGGTVSDAYSSSVVTGVGSVGGLVGESFGGGGISNAYATGEVSGSGDNVGGLVGYNSASISGAHATGNVSGSNYAGGLVGSNSGSISNAHATGSVSGSGYVGGLLGENYSSISDAYATGEVSGSGDNVGGLAGYNEGSISNTYATGSVSGSRGVGGLVGSNNGSSISNAYATGNVSGSNYAGGLVGYNSGSISNAHATGSVSGSSDQIGGLVGINFGTISNAHATGSVSGSGYVGGLVGENYSSISDAYATGEVSGGGDNVGGLVGYTVGSIDTAYATGSVSGSASVGGLVGYNEGSISNAYATGNVSGSSDYAGGLVGYNNSSSFSISISNAYATGNVSGSNYAGGLVGSNSGSISNASATGSVSGSGDQVGGLVGYNVGSIDTAYATGSVSGSASVGGLVGYNEGSISNAYATGNVSGSSDYAGGLVGFNSYGSISNAYATGNVSGGAYDVGGLVGYNYGGIIDTAYATGSVSGVYFVGGLAGENYEGSISNAYATGSVSGTDYVGGLVGSAENATISNTYSSGAVSGSSNVGGLLGGVWGGVTVTSSYWNTDTSGQSSSAGGTGLSSAQMLRAGSFSGWDIATSGGSTSVWRIYEGYTAPLLRSFMTALTVTTGNVSKTYDGSTALSSSYTLSDSSADTSLILGTAAYNSSKNVGSYAVSTSGLYSGQQGYDIRYVNGTATITAVTLTVSGGSAANKTYDGTTAATVSGGSLSGLVSGDSVSLGQSGTFSDKNAATGKTVSYTSSLSGTDAGNYVLASGSGTTTADITVAALTVTANDYSKTADGTAYSGGNGVSYNGFVAGETAAVLSGALAYGGNSQGASAAGSYAIAPGGYSAANYALTYVDGVLNIRQASAGAAAVGGTALAPAYESTLQAVAGIGEGGNAGGAGGGGGAGGSADAMAGALAAAAAEADNTDEK